MLLPADADHECHEKYHRDARVYHELRGEGTVCAIDYGDERGKPYRVRFDNGEVLHICAGSSTPCVVAS